MEGPHLDLGRVVLADELDESFAHLIRGLIREGHSAYRPWRKVAIRNKMGDPHGEHLRLPTAWTGEDLQGNLRRVLHS